MKIQNQIDDTRRHLGELAAMSAQTQAAERRILELAEKRMQAVDQDIKAIRPKALSGDNQAIMKYQDAIMERGKLSLVIAQARAMLS